MERRSLCRILLLSVCILLVLSASASASIIRVKWNSPANGPGDSWDNAYQTVQAAINAASAGDEIWVAAGTYVERITLKKDVALYGGFSGVETERDQRNWVANVTILDGNQGGSVVTASNLGTTTARIDGFTIRNGSASNGGGIYCSNSSPIISNNTITANSASNYGGGIYCYSSSSPIIVNNTIATNSATYGGGIHCYSSSPIISNNSIRSNSAAGGGSGIYCSSSSPTISNNVITSNSITSGSSVPEGGGGIACYSSSPVIANNIIAANTAYGGSSSGGGGIYCYSSSPIISNNTLIANIVRGSSTTNGGGIYCIGSSSSPAISNNIIAFNSSGIYNSSGSPTLRNNCVYNPGSYNYSGVSAGTGDIQVDPKLCYLEYGNFHIKTDSPCIDAGDSSVVQPGWVDIDGQARIQGVSVDIGADESDGTACEEIVPVIVRVSTSGNDSNDGLSWSSAKRSVQSAIEAVYAAGGGEVWVATGTYVERIELRSFVHVYGGFAGTEVSREQRNWVANVTILDGNQGGSVVKASNIGATTARIDGFTIRNGKATYDSGGGILCSYSSPIISNNTIIANNASYGGGICCSSSSPIIYNNAIVGNSSSASSSSYGGGIYCSSSSSPTIYNNTIVGNSATYGGGIYCASPSSAIISNNIVAFNSSGIYNSSGSPTLRNNCVYNPNGYNYSGVSPGTGDIQVDPKLCSLEYGNFHIKLDSPCIDAGDSSVVQPGWVDIDGQARIQGVSVDIGADESDGTACEVEPVIVRVSPSGNDSNDGSSWSSAKRSVQSAIDAVYAAGGGEVWVAAGTYVERITLRSFVHVYGGFAGTETLREQRNWVANATILDGNQGGSVVTVSNIGANTARIDGFTIRNGNAANGGGIYCSSASPIISNNMITANSASTYGGGIYCNHSSPIISSNTITANSTGRYGGGIYCFYSSPVISNNTITTNSAPGGDGGGILCSYSSPTISNNTIVGNSASNGSGIYCSGSSAIVLNNTIAENTASTAGGGIFCISSPSPIIANNVIAANTACGSSSSGGGGIYCYSSSIISNNTIIGNSASPNGGGIYCTGSSSTPAISNNIIAFNTSGIYRSSGSPTLRNNCVYNPNGYNYSGVSPGTGDIQVDPKLCSLEYGNFHIKLDSPCIDAGDSSVVQPGWVDIDGQARIQGVSVDIGADESDGTACEVEPVIVRVSPSGNDSNDGSSWSSAKRNVQSAIDAVYAAGGGEVWVAAGTYVERITLRNFVHVYGGFAGTETLREQRNWVANATILDGNQGGSVVTAIQVGYKAASISGFTIRNGNATNGGGIYCSYASPVISNNTIKSNKATSYGGGIYCIYSLPIISNNTIVGNRASSGGAGIYCSYSSPAILNNTIAANDFREVIYCYYSSPSIFNNIVAFNYTGIYNLNGSPTLRNNCVYNPGSLSYNYNGLSPGIGDIQVDPIFVNRGAGDYHIRYDSPCIDAGDDSVVQPDWLDIDGQLRKNRTVDMGSDEYYSPGVQVTVSGARLLPNGQMVEIHDVVVTGAFDGFFYVESQDRSAGIQVRQAYHGLAVGDKVTLLGTLATDADSGERYIIALYVLKGGTGNIKPLGMVNRALGGGDWMWNPSNGAGQRGVTGGVGLNNIGLLVRTSGCVTDAGTDWFVINDGSGVDVKCVVPTGVGVPAVGSYVALTAISSCEKVGDEIHRLLRIRSGDDIVIR